MSFKRKYYSEDSAEDNRHTRSKNLVEIAQRQEGVKGILVFLQDEGDPPQAIIRNAANQLNIDVRYEPISEPARETPEWGLYIGDELVSRGKYESKTAAKKLLSASALEELRKYCFTIERKVKFISDRTIMISDIAAINPPDEGPTKNSVGAEMLKRMGWKGGGLGSNEQGRLEPVQAYKPVNSADITYELMAKIQCVLDDYQQKNTLNSLLFSNDFTKDQRALIHKMAQKMHLTTKSHGKGSQRMLVVSKRYDKWDLVQILLDAGGETEQYKLICPSNFA